MNAGQYVRLTLDGDGATQYSTAIGGPSFAVDGDPESSSCTGDDRGEPWWMIDLGAVYDVSSVTVTFPATGGATRKYRRSRFIHLHSSVH